MDSTVLMLSAGRLDGLVDLALVLISPDVLTELVSLKLVVYEPSLAHAVTLSPS